MGSGIVLFHKLLAACILLVGSLRVIASPVVISGDSLSARHLIARDGRWIQKSAPVSLCAGLTVDENQQMLLVFREKNSPEFKHAFTKKDDKVSYKEMDNALQQNVKPFIMNEAGDVLTIMVFIPDDQHFLTELTKGLQETQWVKEAVKQLMIRHNSLRLTLRGPKRPAAFNLKDAMDSSVKMIDSMKTREKDFSKP
ncbi:hypothetical protein F5879DRAFT_535903 [Lentinula edodes]|nr:hypothetical protein F5879DRAFT_535903 [Lentinula edodes]KAJ3915840.1 hypothetical protein F5877DRAFT_81450 [Lentinula edodes]